MDNLFGLGIVLDFTDNASAGLLGVGEVLLSLSKRVISVGEEFENARVTLGALYNSTAKAKEKMDWALNLAARTPFEISDITGAVIGLKAINVESSKLYKNSQGNFQSLLEYVGDLAALRPDKGMSAIMRGVREYVGGNARSINQIMDIKIPQILGRKMATTMGGRVQDIVEVSDKLAKGLMAKLQGTWGQILSNINDQITRFFLRVADSGAFKKFKTMLGSILTVFEEISADEMIKLGNVIGDAMSVFIDPLTFLVRALLRGIAIFKNFALANPVVIKFIMTIMTLVTSLALVFGVVSGLVLSLLSLGAAIAFIGPMLPALGAGILVAIKVLLIMGAVALELVGIFALMYVAWQKDVFKIRTVVFTVFNAIKDIISVTKTVLEMGAKDMKNALTRLKLEDTFVAKLSYFLIKAWILWDGFFSAVFNDMTLSEKQFKQLEESGLLPMLETLLDLILYAKSFFEGFAEGSKVVFIWVWGILKPALEWLLDKFFELAESVAEYFGLETDNYTESVERWNKIGFAVGVVVSVLVLLGLAIIVVIGVVSLLVIAFAGFITVASLVAFLPIILIFGVIALVIAGVIWVVYKLVKGLKELYTWVRTKSSDMRDYLIKTFLPPELYMAIKLWDVLTGSITKSIKKSEEFNSKDRTPNAGSGGSFGGKEDLGGYSGDPKLVTNPINPFSLPVPGLNSFIETDRHGNRGVPYANKSGEAGQSSVYINEGAIKIDVANATQLDAEKFTAELLEVIEKQKQLNKISNYEN